MSKDRNSVFFGKELKLGLLPVNIHFVTFPIFIMIIVMNTKKLVLLHAANIENYTFLS